MDAVQHDQRLLIAAVLFAAHFAAKTSDFLVEIAEVSMKFGADFAHDTRAALAETVQKSQEGVARPARHVQCFCALLSRRARAFGAKIAQFCGRSSRDFERKFLNFRALAAANARTNRSKNTDHLFVDDAQHA